MKEVGLKFLLHYGHWLIGIMTENEAQKILKNWMDGTCKPKIAGFHVSTGNWAVDTASIMGMHTIDLSQTQEPQGKPQQSYPWGSGRN